jgi:hypothetical protein
VGEADIAAVTEEEPVAEFPAEQIADVVAENGAGRRGGNDTGNMQILVAPGIQGGNHEHRLAREREPHAFEADDQPHRPIAIRGDEELEIIRREPLHLGPTA